MSIYKPTHFFMNAGFCSVYLINEGRMVNGSTATIQFLGTGGADSYSCRLNNGSLYHCKSPFFSVLLLGIQLYKTIFNSV